MAWQGYQRTSDFFQDSEKKLKMSRTWIFEALGSAIVAFFIFLQPKTYSKVWAESVIQRLDILLVS